MQKIKEYIKKQLLKLKYRAGLDTLYLAKGGFWTTAGFAVTSLFSLALVVAFANLLPKEIYGTYKYVMSVAGLLSFLTLAGMNVAVTQAVAAGNDQAFRYSIKIQLLWNSIYAVGMILTAIYYLINDNPTLSIPLILLGLTFPFNTSLNTYGAYLSGKKDFKTINTYASISSFFYTVVMIGALFLTHDTTALVVAYCIGTFGPTLFFYFRTISRVPNSNISSEQKKDLLSYSGHLSLLSVFSTASQYVDKIVLFHYLGAIELATYGLALALTERVRGYLKSFSNLILPKLSEKTMAEIEPVFYRRLIQSFAVGALFSIGYILIVPYVFKLFLPRYLDAIRYSQVISSAFIFALPATYVGSVFQAQKMLRTLYWSSLSAHISRILLFIIFGSMWGIWGVIWAAVIVNILGTILNIILWEIEVKKAHL